MIHWLRTWRQASPACRWSGVSLGIAQRAGSGCPPRGTAGCCSQSRPAHVTPHGALLPAEPTCVCWLFRVAWDPLASGAGLGEWRFARLGLRVVARLLGGSRAGCVWRSSASSNSRHHRADCPAAQDPSVVYWHGVTILPGFSWCVWVLCVLRASTAPQLDLSPAGPSQGVWRTGCCPRPGKERAVPA